MSQSIAREADAFWFDGVDNRRRAVRLRLAVDLQILENGRVVDQWPLDSIRRAEGPANELRLQSSAAPELARLVVADGGFRSALIGQCPALYAQDAGEHPYARIVGWSLAAALSILVVVVYGIPLIADSLAPMIPVSWEKRVGDMVDGQVKTIFDARTCSGEDGVKAFDKMMKAIAGAGLEGLPVEAKVIRSGVRNAVALPGGRVYLFRGLLDQAENPDEIAGVIAHELGHVKNRDGMRRLIQAGGTSFLLGLLLGDVTGSTAVIFATRQLLDSSYSRDAESRADGVAVEAMTAIGRSPAPAGELLLRITGDQKDNMSILASHPLTRDRLERFKREAKPVTGPPILDFGEWRALKEICVEK